MNEKQIRGVKNILEFDGKSKNEDKLSLKMKRELALIFGILINVESLLYLKNVSFFSKIVSRFDVYTIFNWI